MESFSLPEMVAEPSLIFTEPVVALVVELPSASLLVVEILPLTLMSSPCMLALVPMVVELEEPSAPVVVSVRLTPPESFPSLSSAALVVVLVLVPEPSALVVSAPDLCSIFTPLLSRSFWLSLRS